MSVFSNMYRNKPWFRNVSLIVLGAGIGATSYPFLAPIVLPLFDAAICDGAPGCSGKEIPPIPEIPKKIEEPVDNIPEPAPTNEPV